MCLYEEFVSELWTLLGTLLKRNFNPSTPGQEHEKMNHMERLSLLVECVKQALADVGKNSEYFTIHVVNLIAYTSA